MLEKEEQIQEQKKVMTRSFRVSDDVVEKIKEITSDLGDKASQQDALTVMIEAYEMQKAKFSLGDDAKAVEEFEAHANILIRRFMDKIEEKQMLTETIGTQYEAMLLSKDRTIQDLQARILDLEESQKKTLQENGETQKYNKDLENRVLNLEKRLEEQQSDYKEKMKDKDALNITLQESCTELRQKNESMKNAVEQAEIVLQEKNELERKNRETNHQIEVLQKENGEIAQRLQLSEQKALEDVELLEEKYQSKIEQLKEQQKADIERIEEKLNIETDKKILNKNQEHLTVVETIKKEAQAEIDKYQEKYRQLLERVEEKK